MKRRHCLAGLGAWAAVSLPAVVRAQTRAVRIAAGSNDAYALSYFARDAGFFKQAGIDVDIQLFLNAQASLQAVVGGALDVAVGDAVQVGNAIDGGVDLGFFAPSTSYTTAAPTTYICVAKDGPVKAAKDLEGRTVGVVALSSLMTVGLQQWLKDNGADNGKVKMVEMNFPVMDAAIARGTVDAAILAEPFLSAAGDARLLGDPLGAIAKTFLLSGQIATRAWVAANRDLAGRLAKAYVATATWANTHHDDSAAILSTYAKLPVSRIRTMRRATFATTLTAAHVQPVLDMAAKYGQIPKAVKAASAIITV